MRVNLEDFIYEFQFRREHIRMKTTAGFLWWP